MLPCGALRVYVALRDARPCFDNAVRVRGFANLLVMAADSVDGLELWTVLLVKNVLCDRNVKVSHISTICAASEQSKCRAQGRIVAQPRDFVAAATYPFAGCFFFSVF